MKNEKKYKKCELRTDLAIDEVENNTLKGIQYETNNIDKIKVTKVILEDKNELNKKMGKYITIEFNEDEEEKKIEEVLTVAIKKMIKPKKNSLVLVIGLGNRESTPDSLGPLVIDKIFVTNHLYLLGELSNKYKRVSAINPSVMGKTGIETSDIIESVVNKIKPDYIIVIDSLASKSIERLNKTIQITDTGIHPGSGIGNKRKEISFDTLNVPVIAIGVPTVVDATVIVSDTINFIYKNYAFNKEYMNNPKSKLTFNNINYLNKNIEENMKEKKKLLGLVGELNEIELQKLIYEVLEPIGYNLMVTPKEIDYVVKKMSRIISNSINQAINNIDNLK